MIILCPTNCEHDAYYFQHSVVVTSRTLVEKGIVIEEVRTYIVCRECGHWIDIQGPCLCQYKCHAESGGTEIVRKELYAVE